MTIKHILNILFLFVFFHFGCSSSPRYGNQTYPGQKTKSRPVPVEKSPQLSYKRSWVGLSSWYGEDFHGKKTANGEIFDMHALTAAHKTLPLGTKVRVTNLENNRSVVVRINDRGPYVEGRILDLSYGAAKALGFENMGMAKVHIQVISFGNNRYKK
jgi:rare lipoprotein A